MLLPSFVLWLSLQLCSATVTLYPTQGQKPLTASTNTGNTATPTATGGVNSNVRLTPPPVPSPLPAMTFPIQLQTSGTVNLSIPQFPGFMGFSLEMSVANQVLGKNSSLIQVPFLNLMGTLQERSGRVNIRVGGNSQENAVLVDLNSLPNGRVIAKGDGAQNPTHTPALLFTADLLYMMRNISDMVNVYWFLGAPFNDSQNFRLQIVEQGQAILGQYLMAIQVGNEPDLYPGRLRPDNYTQSDFFGEWANFITAIRTDPNIKNTTMLMGPSISSNGHFTEQQMWDTGFVDSYSENIAFLTTEHYPDNNCAAIFNNGGTPVNYQAQFPNYLNHQAGLNSISGFVASANFAQSKGKRYLMMETNTASCGGFPGISDSFGAAIWAVDYALTLAFQNFSSANFHVGGQAAFYNPFTPPPTNESSFSSWTVGPIFYAAVVVAEALGTQTSQVLDLGANSQSIFTPAYAIYENGAPVRMVLINYITDPSGQSTYTAQISVGNVTPSQIKVKYLSGYSVSDKYNFTWAGQSMGGVSESNGLFTGQENITTIPCNGGTCNVTVPAPAVALVFLSDSAIETAASPTSFTTSVFTKTHNTATVAKSVLATSNGHSGKDRDTNDLSTSRGSSNDASTSRQVFGLWGTLSIVLITALLHRRFIPVF